MPYPHLRTGENRNETTPGRSPGVVILVPHLGRCFFPGGTYEQSMMLARSVLTEEQLKHPQTRIEWGYGTCPKDWVCQTVMKVPITATANTVEEPKLREAEQGWG